MAGVKQVLLVVEPHRVDGILLLGESHYAKAHEKQ